jgi:tellurite resistance protein
MKTEAPSIPPVSAAGGSGGPAALALPAPVAGDTRWAKRSERINLLSISLGAAGMGGAWQAAAHSLSVPIGVSDVLFTISGLVWVALLSEYIRHGGARWSTLRHDLRHPAQGFTLAYVPIIGMLFAGHLARFGLEASRWSYTVFVAGAALAGARLLAYWFTGTLSSVRLHPGYLLPVSSGPFIASITASVVQWPKVADAAFAVGVLYWLVFGTVILSSLVGSGSLPERARPTLTVLIIPPATGGLAWLAAHPGPVDAVGYGFAGLLGFTVLIVSFLVSELGLRTFHTGYWIFSFPVAASANFVIRWSYGADLPAWRAVSWLVLGAATLFWLALVAATGGHALRLTRTAA